MTYGIICFFGSTLDCKLVAIASFWNGLSYCSFESIRSTLSFTWPNVWRIFSKRFRKKKKNIMCIYIDIWQVINSKWHQFAYISSLDSFFDTVSFNFSTLGETSSNVFVKRLMLIHIHQAADYGTIVSIVPIRKLLPFLCFDTWYIFGVFYFFNS